MIELNKPKYKYLRVVMERLSLNKCLKHFVRQPSERVLPEPSDIPTVLFHALSRLGITQTPSF